MDRRRKLHVTTLLRAIGLSSQQILDTFYNKIQYKKVKNGWSIPFNFEKMKGIKLTSDLIDSSTGKVVVEAGTKMTQRLGKKLVEEGLESYLVSSENLAGQFIANDIIDSSTKEIILEAGSELRIENVNLIENLKITLIEVLDIDNVTVGSYIRNTLFSDKNTSTEDGLIDIYKVMRAW